MNPQFFGNQYLITKISLYLNINDIIYFSSCNKIIHEKLYPLNNLTINSIFNYEVTQKFFEIEEDYDLDNIHKNARNHLFDNTCKINFNWKSFLSHINYHFKIYDSKISKIFLDSFKVHMYLPDLRKENYHLEFPYSSVHQILCYDKRFKEIYKYNYYGYYINDDYFKNSGKKADIKILRKGLPFEYQLKHFKIIYEEFLNNEEYKKVITFLINYNFEKLSQIYQKLDKNNNINNIIYFILWSNNSFFLYCIDILENVNDNRTGNEKKFLEQYITKFTNYINSTLLINSNFENINIIVNYLNQYVLQKQSDDKFSLYELARRIFKKIVFDKLEQNIRNKTSILYINFLNNKINNKNVELQEEKEKIKKINDINDSNNSSECDMMSLDYSMEFIKKKPEKDILENLIQCILDIVIDKDNANLINHSKIILGEEYSQFEKILIDITLEFIQKNINKGDKSFLEIFEILEGLLKNNGNYRNLKLNINSLKFINRTKKRMVDESIKLLFKLILPKVLKDFNVRLRNNKNGRFLFVTNNEIINKNNYKVDLSEFSDKKQMVIEGKAVEEINKIKINLYEQNINGYNVEETKRIVNEYFENNGIDLVLLMKKMIYFYLIENELYNEQNLEVYNILNKKNIGNINISLDNLI